MKADFVCHVHYFIPPSGQSLTHGRHSKETAGKHHCVQGAFPYTCRQSHFLLGGLNIFMILGGVFSLSKLQVAIGVSPKVWMAVSWTSLLLTGHQ